MTTELFLIFIVGAVIGAIIGYLIAFQKKTAAENNQKNLDNDARNALQTQVKVLETESQFKSQQIEEQKQQYQQQIEALKLQQEQQLEEIKLQQQKQLEQQMKLITEQMKTATEEMLQKRSEQLQAQNSKQMELLQSSSKEQLSRILDPLNNGLKMMREQVEKADREQTEKMTALDATIKATLQQTANVSASADKLANALTTENKTVGNFGELRLRTLLENMGFQEGLQFEEQYLMRDATGQPVTHDESGQKLIPDTILHFPEGRDLIIDSKMSLKAFNDYFSAETDDERAEALKRHVESVRSHVDGLSAKKYYKYISGERQTVDFVVMYMYSDNALQLALSADSKLWEEAAKKGVFITGSHNLYMLLRIVLLSWDRMRQAENMQKMMEQADNIVQRVQDFYTRLIEVEEGFKKTQKAFDSLKITTSPTGRSIVTAARQLIEYGAKEDRANKKRRLLPKDEELLAVEPEETTTETEIPTTEAEIPTAEAENSTAEVN